MKGSMSCDVMPSSTELIGTTISLIRHIFLQPEK